MVGGTCDFNIRFCFISTSCSKRLFSIVNAIIVSSRLFIMPAEFGDGAEVRGIAPPFFPDLGLDDGSGLSGVTSAPGLGFAPSIVIIKLLSLR